MKHIVFDCDGTLLSTSSQPYQLYPGIKDLIVDLAQDCQLYVWTARGRASTLRILQDGGVLSYFESLYCADDGIGKPHILGLMTLLGPTPRRENVWVIGDTTNDIQGARNYGVKSIGVVWNGQAREVILKEAGADFIATKPQECSTLIRLYNEEG